MPISRFPHASGVSFAIVQVISMRTGRIGWMKRGCRKQKDLAAKVSSNRRKLKIFLTTDCRRDTIG
jgi:hypothetical protein